MIINFLFVRVYLSASICELVNVCVLARQLLSNTTLSHHECHHMMIMEIDMYERSNISLYKLLAIANLTCPNKIKPETKIFQNRSSSLGMKA